MARVWPAALCAYLAVLMGSSGCFLLPFRPHDDPDPHGGLPHGSDPDVDDDGDGLTETEGDCDDGDADVFPGAAEQANGVDDDCDGEVDEPPEPVDADEDGWTPEDGDCDDGNPDVHPDRVDDCDELDNDCDGQLNEDTAADDPQEPNDDAPYGLGNLTDSVATVGGFLHNGDDVDRVSFLADDGLFGNFGIEVELSGIPGDADYVLELWLGAELVGYSDTSGGEQIVYEGEPFHDDGGTYEVEVHAVLGFSCSEPYVLTIVASG